MKTTIRIALAELRSLFCSPIAWLILVIFAFQSGLAFSDAIGRQIQSQAMGYGLWGATSGMFTGWMGIFPGLLGNLYLYIPLLTMGLMSREYSSGSIKLLYSSPVTNPQIILGKYLSVLVYNLALIFPLLVMAVFTGLTVKDADLPLVFSGILGIYLLICAYGAIGLFMSSITSYQVVAAMGTLAVLAALNYVGEVGQDYAFVRDITYWLSISGRAYQFIDGLICTEDVLYFLIVIVLFISLSILKLRAGRSKVSRARSWGTYTAVVAAAFLVGYLSTLPSLKFYYDCTATKSNTLTRTSQDIVKKLDGGLTITTYVNLLEPNYGSGLPSQLKYDVERFEQYLRFKPEIKMRYVYFWDKADNESLDDRFVGLDDRQKAEKMSKILDLDFDMFLTPEEIRKVIDLRPEGNRFVRVIERENGQRSFLRLYDDNQKHPSETEISAALKRFVVKSPKVAFLTGHGMRDIHKTGDRDYNRFAESIYFRYSLINQGFDVLTVDLSREDIPADVDIVVIADMRTPFDEAEGGKLSAYVNRGGNLFILGDYRRQEVMNPVVAPFGVSFLPGVLVEPNDVDLPTLTVGHITAQAAEAFPTYRRPYAYGYTISMPEATALSFDPLCGFTALPVIVSGEKSWTELQTTDFLDQVPTADSLSGERPGSYPTVLALTRQVGDKEQRIVISGDADCVSNYELGKTRNGVNSSNFTLLTGSFKWLSYGEYPLDTTRPEPTDNEIYLGRDSRRWIKYGFAGLLPLALAACGITIRVRRRRR